MLLIQCSAIKPGQRFSDEQSTMSITEKLGVRMTGTKDLSLFQQKSKVAKAEKAIEADSTFSVSLSKKDKANRDKA